MKILKYDDIEGWSESTVLVLGYFDGLHRGHQVLFKKARKIAATLNLKIAVLTFPERADITFKKFEPEMLLKLTSDQKRANLFAENGVDYLIFKALTSEFASHTSEEFIHKFLKPLNPQVIVTGFDYTAGSDMVNLESTDEIKVVQVPKLADLGGKISSTRIREAIKIGNVAEGGRLLGYDYETVGLVVHGFKRGREIGYPTANLIVKDYIHIPGPGVYVVDVLVGRQRQRGFASIGTNETFNGKEQTVEVHIFDFNQDIYGESLTVFWLDRIRAMVKFDGIESLIYQMEKDEVVARNWQGSVLEEAL